MARTFASILLVCATVSCARIAGFEDSFTEMPPPSADADVPEAAVDATEAGSPEGGPDANAALPPVIYAASTRFWRFDPKPKTWAGGQELKGDCDGLNELAIDSSGRLFGTANGAKLLRVTPDPLGCTALPGTGPYPTRALAFAPAGTVDTGEVLVGYQDNGDYVRIDTTSGAVTVITAAIMSNVTVGDIVNVGVKGYVVASGGPCTDDCVWEIDLATGMRIGASPTGFFPADGLRVTGLAQWQGRLMAFTENDRIYDLVPTAPGSAVAVNGPPNMRLVNYRGAASMPTQ